MVKSIGQILIIKWKDGRVTKKKCPGWSEFADMREKYDNDPRVSDTEAQYDV